MKGSRGYYLSLIGLLLGLSGAVGAEDGEKLAGQSGGSWEESEDAHGGLWKKSRDMAADMWESTQDLFFEDGADNGFGHLWNEIIPKLEQTLTLEDRQAGLPENAWFGPDRVSNRNDISELLDDAVAILSDSPVQRYRERIRALELQIRSAKNEIAQYRTRRIAAPRDSLWSTTVADYDTAIAEQQERIQTYRDQLQAIKQEFAKELQDLGLVLNDEQMEFLLSTVIGDNLLELGIAFDNVKTITLQLENLLEETEEDLESARRYYGMYVVLLKVLERMHTQLVDAINTRYLREIEGILRKTRELSMQTRKLQSRADANRAMLSSNLAAQQFTLRAATAYRNYLLEQSRELERARGRLNQDIATAWNTYETVKVSGELVALIKTSQRMLDNLLERQAPALRSFQNLEMKREFAKLTARLRDKGQ